MGEVYRATDPKLGREVAIKVLPAEVAGDPERLGVGSTYQTMGGYGPGGGATLNR